MKPIIIDLDVVRAGAAFQILYYDRWLTSRGSMFIIGSSVPDERIRGMYNQVWASTKAEQEWMIPNILEAVPGGVYAQPTYVFESEEDRLIATSQRKIRYLLRIWFHERDKDQALIFKLTHGGIA